MSDISSDLILFNELVETLINEEERHPVADRIDANKLYNSIDLSLNKIGMVDDEFKEGNTHFNSNTIFYSLEIDSPKSTAFELKNQNTEARVKLNMGDVTFDNESVGIGGRVGRDHSMVEYENFKNYGEYGLNGGWYVQVHQANWMKIISKGRNPATSKK